jgi:hypothetical protein
MTPFREIVRILRGKPKVHSPEYSQVDPVSAGSQDLTP